MNLRTLFRFLYNASYYILCTLLGALVLVTPSDAVYQAFKNKQLYNVFVICGCYLLTAILASTIYIVRMYTNRQILAAIPKTWIPVEKGDVNKKVRKMIAASLGRSAVIAWDSRPRIDQTAPTVVSNSDAREAIVRPETAVEKKRGFGALRKQRSSHTEQDDHIVVIPPTQPVWGDITHDGWSSPESPDFPNVQYITVILELPHLIEARAVSVAPPDPNLDFNQPIPNLQAVELLQRPAHMGLRDYVGYLIGIGILTSPPAASDFLIAYEHARFSTECLSEHQFRHLMKLFAELLRCIQPLSPAILASLDIDQLESDIDDDNSSSSTPRSRSQLSADSFSSRSRSRSRSPGEQSVQTAHSRRGGTTGSTPITKFPEFVAAPATPKSKNRAVSRSPSTNNFAQSRLPYNESSGESSTSLVSSTQGSVIRLRGANEEGDLPYTLMVPGPR